MTVTRIKKIKVHPDDVAIGIGELKGKPNCQIRVYLGLNVIAKIGWDHDTLVAFSFDDDVEDGPSLMIESIEFVRPQDSVVKLNGFRDHRFNWLCARTTQLPKGVKWIPGQNVPARYGIRRDNRAIRVWIPDGFIERA